MEETKPFTLSERLNIIKLSNFTGQEIALSGFHGKPVFLNFWATWCGPCISELKSIQEISKQFKGDIIFLMASSENIATIQSFISKNKFELNFVHLDVPYIDAYVVKLPTTLLIDSNGQISEEEEGFRIWTQDVYLKKLKNLVCGKR